MDFGFVVAPSPVEAEGYLELARTQSGTLYRKHILTKGTLIHPKTGKKIDINDAFIGKLTSNFTSKVCDIVQVPLANDSNDHSEDPSRNKGEVIGIETKGDKVYALVDAREDADKFGKTYLGASAMMHLDYTDTKTGKKVGPTLLHMAVTNRPYVTDLDPYEKVVEKVALSATSATDNDGETVLLTPFSPEKESEVPATKAELLAALKEQGVDASDLAALGIEAPAPAPTALSAESLVAVLRDNGLLSLSQSEAPETVTPADIVGAIAELAEGHTALSNTVEELTTEKATAEVDKLVGLGHILPAQRDAMLELRLSNAEMFLKVVPKTPLVKLSAEEGADIPSDQPELDVDAEIAKLTNGDKTSQYFARA